MTNFPNLIIIEDHSLYQDCKWPYVVGDQSFESKEEALLYILKELGYTVIIED